MELISCLYLKVLTEQARLSSVKHLPSFGDKKIPGIENVKLIWNFHFDHDFALNLLIIFIFPYHIAED